MTSRWLLVVAGVGLAGVAQAEPESKAQRLAPGVRLEAQGKVIDVDIGHAAPFVVDWDEDGRLDLLVGQFGDGRLRFYRDRAKEGAAKLEASTFVLSETKEISVPSG
jgi:hypothetical protein